MKKLGMNISQLNLWILAIRPRTLPASVAPVIVGTAMAISDEGFKSTVALAALAGALLLQIGANLANDYFDYIKGIDTADRLGPVRVMQGGLISAKHLRTGIIIVFIFTAMVGLYLISVGGWIILFIGLISILAGLAYSGGPHPLASHGLGDVFVFTFFGFVAVCGTYYAQTLHLTILTVLMSIPVGMLVTSILVVNNLRDIITDRKAGKYTLAVMIGKRWTKIEYLTLLVSAYIIPVIFCLSKVLSGWVVLLPIVSLPMAIHLIYDVQHSTGAALNQTLAGTAKLSLVFSLLLSIGLII